MSLHPDITHVRRYPVHPLLGRHMVLDRRSLDFQVEEIDPHKLRPVDWTPRIPILDQSDLDTQGIDVSTLLPGAPKAKALGSCTGNSSSYALSTLLDADKLNRIGLSTTDPVAAEVFAIRWYSAASLLDEWNAEQYPADDCGSSGLGTSKAGISAGWFDSFRTATSALGVVSALQHGAGIFGMPWMKAFFEPGPDGFIDSDPDWARSGVAGGHEVCAAKVDRLVVSGGHLDLDKTVLAFPNSWTRSWGDDGWFRMRLSTYQKLRSKIDVYQFQLAA